MSVPPKSARSVTCPSCGKPTLFAPANPSRPFCSERCRLTDLGGWASEAYRVPVKPAEDEPELEPPGSDPNSSAQ